MLKPAILFKDELEKKFAEEIYTDRYLYYCGYAYDFVLPTIKAQSEHFQWAITEPIDNFTDKVIGYLAYRVNPTTDNVYNFGLYSFDEGNQTVIRDTYDKLEELVKTHHRVEWRVIEGNHAKRGYDAFCSKHNGNCVCLHDVTKDLHGEYRNEYIYEINSKPRPIKGKWERHYSRPNVYSDLFWHCSACGYKCRDNDANLFYKYCPECGVSMGLEVEDNA